MQNKSNEKLSFAFFGTPDVASLTLDILKGSGYLPSLIITSPDAKKGRGLQLQASPVTLFAEKNNIKCLKPENLDEEFIRELKASNCDLFIVVAYGKIIPEKLIKMPKLGSINIHYSLLPKYRGASPVESAILNGDKETGVSIQQMEYKMDSGAVIVQEKLEIFADEKAPDLRKRLIQAGGDLLVKSIPKIIRGEIIPTPQNEKQATSCKKIKKEEGLIDLNESAALNYNKFRAYALWPRTYFFQNEKRVIITDATLENNQFIIKKVLPEGKKEITYEDFLKTSTSK